MLSGKGVGSYAAKVDYAGAASSLAPGDVNGDGKQEIVVTMVAGSCR